LETHFASDSKNGLVLLRGLTAVRSDSHSKPYVTSTKAASWQHRDVW